MGLKLNEFHLASYSERSVLATALHYFSADHLEMYPEYKTAVKDLLVRLSRTECQEGGCPYCNADRAREEEEWRDADDEYYRQQEWSGFDSQEMDDNSEE
jgi:hypothetical protein